MNLFKLIKNYYSVLISIFLFLIIISNGVNKCENNLQDYRFPGPYAVSKITRIYQVDSKCQLIYDLYTPKDGPKSVLTILAHGFSRSKENVAGWAKHLASWGLTVATPNLCHSTVADNDHFQNGLDMIVLAKSLTDGAVIYSGHSAGGLSSLVAAAYDPLAIAEIGLDSVDVSEIGYNLIPIFPQIPAYGLFGEPSECNANNNTLPIYLSISDGRAIRITESDHCDYENPLDKKCNLVCPGTNETFSNKEIEETIKGLLTSFILWQSGLDPNGAKWWIKGEVYYEELVAKSAISEIETY